jgi:predicted enzyme related to lactoylglutathione lyase
MSEHALAAGTTFPWHELYVADAAAGKAFYAGTLGWESTDFDMGEMGTYPMLIANGKPIAGIMGTAGNPQMEGVPPHWAVYIAVADVDSTVQTAESLGGKVVVPAMDVPTVGRMCLLQDPQGAHFWVYKSASEE